MKFYIYRRVGAVSLDFCVHRAQDEDWAFELCDVQEAGVAYCAGIRSGDRLSGVTDFDAPSLKNPHNWDDESLNSLNEAEAGTLFVLFVEKRVPLSFTEDYHVKKRSEFISARKSNLKKLGRLDELPKFVVKWDNKNAAIKEPNIRDGQDAAPKSTRSRSRPQIIRLCVYDPEFCVRKGSYAGSQTQYKIHGVQEGSVAYGAGIRNGDLACGFKYCNEDGRAKSHAWHDHTLSELKKIGVFFIDVCKISPLQKTSLSYSVKRERYISKIKSRLASAFQLDEFLFRVRNWDNFQAIKYEGDEVKAARIEEITGELEQVRGTASCLTTPVAEPEKDEDILAASLDEDKSDQFSCSTEPATSSTSSQASLSSLFDSATKMEEITTQLDEDTNISCILDDTRILETMAKPDPIRLQKPTKNCTTDNSGNCTIQAVDDTSRLEMSNQAVQTNFHHEPGNLRMENANVNQQENSQPSSRENAVKVYPKPSSITKPTPKESHHSSKKLFRKKMLGMDVIVTRTFKKKPHVSTESTSLEIPRLKTVNGDLRSETRSVDATEHSVASEDEVWNDGNTENVCCNSNNSDDAPAILDGNEVVFLAEISARAPQNGTSASSRLKRCIADQEVDEGRTMRKTSKRAKTSVPAEKVSGNVSTDGIDAGIGFEAAGNFNYVKKSGPVSGQAGPPGDADANRASAAAAAKKLLIAVASKPRLKRLIKFPNWEKRLLELLNRSTDEKTMAWLEATVSLLAKARLKLDSSETTLEVCADWVLKAVECVPMRDGYSLSMSIPVDRVRHSVVQVKEKMSSAKQGSANARQLMLAWKAATDCILEAVSAFKECVLQQQIQSRDWKQWLESVNEHIIAQREGISQISEESRAMMETFELATTHTKQKTEQLEGDLKSEVNKAEDNIADLHREQAAAGDFDNCARYRCTHMKVLSSDQTIALLHDQLTKCSKEARASEKKAVAAREVLAFWQSLLVLFDIIECQHSTQIKLALKKLDASTEAFHRQVKQALSWIGVTLIDALEHYFDQSFRVQENALDRVEKLRLEREEHNAKFGGYFSFDESAAEVYQHVVTQSKAEDHEVMQSQLEMWKDTMQSMPEFTSLFAFGALDQELTKMHGGLWGEIKKPLEKVIDDLFSHEVDRCSVEAPQVPSCDPEAQEESEVSLVVQTSSMKMSPDGARKDGVAAAKPLHGTDQKYSDEPVTAVDQEVEEHHNMDTFMTGADMANVAANAESENGCSIM